jgi:hypothetical protein
MRNRIVDSWERAVKEFDDATVRVRITKENVVQVEAVTSEISDIYRTLQVLYRTAAVWHWHTDVCVGVTPSRELECAGPAHADDGRA